MRSANIFLDTFRKTWSMWWRLLVFVSALSDICKRKKWQVCFWPFPLVHTLILPPALAIGWRKILITILSVSKWTSWPQPPPSLINPITLNFRNERMSYAWYLTEWRRWIMQDPRPCEHKHNTLPVSLQWIRTFPLLKGKEQFKKPRKTISGVKAKKAKPGEKGR